VIQCGTFKPKGGSSQLSDMYMGDGNKVAVETVRVCNLRLESDFLF